MDTHKVTDFITHNNYVELESLFSSLPKEEVYVSLSKDEYLENYCELVDELGIDIKPEILHLLIRYCDKYCEGTWSMYFEDIENCYFRPDGEDWQYNKEVYTKYFNKIIELDKIYNTNIMADIINDLEKGNESYGSIRLHSDPDFKPFINFVKDIVKNYQR